MMNLTPDAFYILAQNLTGGELMKMCSVNNKIRSICTSMKFNPIWTDKLLKDFNVKYGGNDAYMEYLQHAYLYKQTYWTASIFNKNDNYIVKSKIFHKNSDAATFLANEAMKYHKRNRAISPPKYFKYLATLRENGSFEDFWNKYELTESEFETKPQETENYNNYITKLRYLYDIVNSNNHQILENLEDVEKDFEAFRMDFEIIISEEEIDDEEIDESNDIWERFRMEILPSYIEKLDKKKTNEIKSAVMEILNLKNVYEENGNFKSQNVYEENEDEENEDEENEENEDEENENEEEENENEEDEE